MTDQPFNPAPDNVAPVAPARSLGRLLTRRAVLKRLVAYAGVPLVAGTYATQIEPFWPVFHEIPIAIRNLPPSFEGYRITQLTDLHVGETPMHYVRKVVDQVRESLKPDLVVVTGDLTHHDARWAPPVAELLAKFSVPVIVTYGNHEYGVIRADGTGDGYLPDRVAAAVLRCNLTLLRNQSFSVDRPDGRLWFVGLDDLWWGQCLPMKAYAGVPADAAVITLSHNPDTAPLLDVHRPSIILAGHTHGGQVRIPFLGAPYLNVFNHQWDQGMFQLKHSRMYVCRGIGYVRRVRFNCRPEIPTFRLHRA